MRKIRRMIQYIRARRRLNKKLFMVYTVLRILVILAAIGCFFEGNYESVAYCVLSLLLFLLPTLFEVQLKVRIPPLFEGLIYVFIYAAEILGEVNRYYTLIPGWDSMLHTINGFLCAAIGLSLIDIINRTSKRVQLSPLYLAIVAFCFSMTIGVIWEFIEFFMDHTFMMDMQKDFIVRSFSSVTLDPKHAQTPVLIDHIRKTVIYGANGKKWVINGGYLDIGIIDTMKDLFVNFIGALTFSVIGYFYEKKHHKNNIAGSLVLHSLSDEELEEENEAVHTEMERLNRKKGSAK